MQVGSFGEAYFPIGKNGFKMRVRCFGTIKETDGKLILFVDNDGYEYLVKIKEFQFIPEKV